MTRRFFTTVALGVPAAFAMAVATPALACDGHKETADTKKADKATTKASTKPDQAPAAQDKKARLRARLDAPRRGLQVPDEGREVHLPQGRVQVRYRQIVREVLGADPPMIVLAGGITSPEANLSEEDRIAQALAIRQMLAASNDAQGVQAFAFYPLATDPAHPDADRAWYSSPASPKPLAEAFLRAAAQAHGKAAPTPAARPNAGRRYILLPSDPQPAADLDWPALSRLAIEANSAMGASVEEAARCQEVVLACLPSAYSAHVIDHLEASGCILLHRHHPAGMPLGVIPSHVARASEAA